MDHLAEAKRFAERAKTRQVQANSLLAIANAAIALVELLAERLPPIAETASECSKRLREAECAAERERQND